MSKRLDGHFADSPLEGTGYELPVPRAMQRRPKAIIDGFRCMAPSLDYLRLPLVEISEGGPRRNLGTEALSRAGPKDSMGRAARRWQLRRCI
jgi:hypothetical protein